MKKNWAWILITLAALMAGSFIEGAIAQRDTKFISGNLIVCDHRTPISSLPFTISNPGSYFLTTNLIGSPGLDGITIEADDVTIDLNGFTLTGVAGSVDGIVTPGAADGITIANGAIADWGADGIDLESAANVRIRDVRVSTCITAFRLSDAVVDACSVTGNFNAIFARNGSIFRDCVVKDNGGSGLRLNDSQLIRSTVVHAGTQRALILDAGQCTVTDCRIHAFGATAFNSPLKNAS